MRKSIGLMVLTGMMTACAAQTHTTPITPISALKLLAVQEIPYDARFKGTTVGGLSGIDYDSTQQSYYLISDDRSALQPARFYTMKVYLNNQGFDSLRITDVDTLRQPDGFPFPNTQQDPAHTPDPEALRYDPVRKQMVWTSEGERIVSNKDTVLENPSIHFIEPDGKFIDSIPLPRNLWMHATEKGPRRNGVLEGITYANGYKTLYVSLEEPRYEDGERADIRPNDAWVRIYRFNRESLRNTAQYAYKLEPIAYPAFPADAFKINGIPDILSAGGTRLLVMERSFSTGRMPCTIKIFLTDCSKAEDISKVNSLKRKPPTKPLQKKLLLNMDDLGIYVDNVEGMTFGPTLPNGHRTLLMVSDNNFSQLEKTQLFLFEVMP